MLNRTRHRRDRPSPVGEQVISICRILRHELIVEPDGSIDIRATRIVTGTGNGGAVLQRIDESLLTPPPARSFAIRGPGLDVPNSRPSTGLAPIIEYICQHRGIPCCDYSAAGILPLPAPVNDPAINSAGELLALVRSNSTCLIRRGHGIHAGDLIAALSIAWPDAKIAVGTAKHSDAQRIFDRLRAIGIAADLVTPRYCPDAPGRLVVGTFTSLADSSIEIEKRDIMVLPHALDALRNEAEMCLLAVESRFRIVGIIGPDVHVSPYEAARLMATFGPREITLPRPGYVEELPRVLWYEHHTYAGLLQFDGRIPERGLVWHNRIRNRRIARLAKSIATLTGSSRPSRVIVLGANLEQAMRLAERLPGWPVECGPTTGLSAKQARLLASRRGLWPLQGFVTTPAGLEQLAPADNGITVLLWAGAGSHLPALPGSWLSRPDGQDRSVQVLDIADAGEPTLLGWARQRQAAYRRNGWIGQDELPVDCRIKEFLRTVEVTYG